MVIDPSAEEAKKPEPIALFDMDGTVVDFDGGMEEGMRSLASPHELALGRQEWFPMEQDGEPAHITARRRLVKKQPGFWRNLKQLPIGMALFRQAMELKFTIHMLTKSPNPVKNAGAWTEKAEWCVNNLPMDQYESIGINQVTDKGLFYGRVLFDDYVPYVLKWLKHRKRGTVFMPAWPWNEGFQHPQVIRVATDADLKQAFHLMAQIRAGCLP